MHWQRNIEVLTPLFNRGAYQDTPEIRVPSIRGMVRWWFRALGGTSDEEKLVFGGMKHFGQRTASDVVASRLVFRVMHTQTQRGRATPTLPHKRGGEASPQMAFPEGVRFILKVVSRFGDLSPVLATKAQNALEAWLLLGALGLRANRCGGNVWPADDLAPATPTSLGAQLKQLGCHWPVMLVGQDAGTTLEQLRAAATDTVNGADWVFGFARGRERLASALKFKIVRFGQDLRLLAFAPDQSVLDEARIALHGHLSKPESWSPINQ